MTQLELESKLLDINKELKEILCNRQYYPLLHSTRIELSIAIEDTTRLAHRVLDKLYDNKE